MEGLRLLVDGKASTERLPAPAAGRRGRSSPRPCGPETNNRGQNAPAIRNRPQIADPVQSPELDAGHFADGQSGAQCLDVHAGFDFETTGIAEIHVPKDVAPEGVVAVAEIREASAEP